MNTQNLTPEEIKSLHTLLGKMMEQPQPIKFYDQVDEMIDDILDNFNFSKVQTAMEATGWRYASSEGKDVTINELKNKATYCLKGAAEARLNDYIEEHWEQGIIVATGGFQAMAYCDKDKTKIVQLELKFILAEWDSEIEEDGTW
jgi:hypothetical protein